MMKCSLYGMTLIDFINYIIKFENVEDILILGDLPSDKGFIYERLWDIVIKLGYCNKFPNSKFIHKIGNADNCNLNNLENLDLYLDNEKGFYIL